MYHLNIPNVSCAHCVSTVEKAIKSVDPDAKVAVDLESKTASIKSPAPIDDLVAALEKAGYPALQKACCCGHPA